MSRRRRSRLILAGLLAALALPCLWALVVDHAKPVRWWGAATLVGIWAVQFARDRMAADRGPVGNPSDALTLFVEPVAWLGIRWGYRRFLDAADAVAVPGSAELFSWSRSWRSFLVLPDLMARRRNLRHAERLAERLSAHAAAHPGSPVHIVAYSSGGFIALEALRLLPENVCIERLTMLAPTVSPGYDLSSAGRRCREMVCVSSWGDFLINGLGAVVFGTNDRRHTWAAGMVGFAAVPEGRALRQIPWRPSWARRLWLGGHFTVSSTPMLMYVLDSGRAMRQQVRD